MPMDFDWLAIDDPDSDAYLVLHMTDGIIVLANLHLSIDTPRLRQMLSSAFPDLQWCYIVEGMNGDSLGHGYAKFPSAEDAQTVIEQISVLTSHNAGYPVWASLSSIDGCTRFVDAGKFCVDGFRDDVDEESMRKVFEAFGPCYTVQRTHPGNVYVHFTCEWHAQKAIADLQGREVDGQRLTFSHYDRVVRTLRYDVKRLAIQPFNLPRDMTAEELKDKFDFLGVVHTRILKNSDGSPRGTGYVHFERPYNDTPMFKCFTPYDEDDDINTDTISWSLRHKFPMREHYMSKFPEEATPTYNQYLYEIPDDYRGCVPSKEYENFSNSKQNSSFFEACLGAYHVHVSNVDGHTDQSLTTLFARFGRVIFCSIQKGAYIVEEFAIVSYRTEPEAKAAVCGVREMRSEQFKVTAELIDSSQIHYQNQKIVPGTLNDDILPFFEEHAYIVEKNGVAKRFRESELQFLLQKRMSQIVAQNMKELAKKYGVNIPLQQKNYEYNSARTISNGAAGLSNQSLASAQRATSSFISGINAALSGTELSQIASAAEKGCTKILEKLNKMFPKSTDEQKQEMISALASTPASELPKILMDDQNFRTAVIQRTVAYRRNKLK